MSLSHDEHDDEDDDEESEKEDKDNEEDEETSPLHLARIDSTTTAATFIAENVIKAVSIMGVRVC